MKLHILRSNFYLPEILVYTALDSVSTKAQIDKLIIAEHYIVLIECIIKGLVQILQVQQDHSFPSLHANFDLVDVATDLQ